MYSTGLRSIFFGFLKFLKIREGGSNFWGKAILKKVWIIRSPLLYFNFTSFMDPNFSSLIRFQCILHDWALFWEFWNFYKLKRGDLISGRKQFCRKSELSGPPLLYFHFKSFLDPIFSSLIRFQWTLHDSGTFFWALSNFYKLNSWDLIFEGNQICGKSELYDLHFCISIWKVLYTQIFRHSSDFNVFYMIPEDFSQSFEISRN